jgi:hypothetical protein
MGREGRNVGGKQPAAAAGKRAGEERAATRSASRGSSPSSSVDPRKALAERMIRDAQARLEAESAPPARRRQHTSSAGPRVVFSFDVAALVHVVLGMVALTVAALACLFCYHMLYTMFVLGRILALPTGVLTVAALSYLSVCYLGVVASTANGRTTLEDHVTGEWREWFWSLPSSFGMLAWAGFLGYLVTMPMTADRWPVVGLITWALYPVLQLSVLENEFPLMPFSLPVLKTLLTRPASWLIFYFCSVVPVAVPAVVGWASFVDPPYVTVLCTAPVAALALFVYAWLFGQLTHDISKEFPRD